MKNRSRLLQQGTPGTGNVLYWMSREQRASNNPGLIFAANLAKERGKHLEVLFVLDDTFPEANQRSFSFLLEGLQETKTTLESLNIPFNLRLGNIPSIIISYLHLHKNALLVIDFNPLHHALAWKKELLSSLSIPIYEVDGHNIVPCWIASEKQEFAARTFRPKINRHLYEFLYPMPENETLRQEYSFIPETTDWKEILSSLKIDRSVEPVKKSSGETAARKTLQTFIHERIGRYATERNHIETDGCSGLSPYLHFGQISALEIALKVMNDTPADANREAFLEQLIVRRELAENFCYHNPDYDSFDGFPSWAKKTLLQHQRDEREHLYSLADFEQARTHDELWNKTQSVLIKSGTMHNYLRMFWGKKILEWSPSAEEAMQIAVYLNDKYQLDGRDPNGYTGCAWCIGGVHDRPWFNRPIFGNIRYMGANKFKNKQPFVPSLETE